jgi:glycine/D-amino acid oxidase-like deaminating enzyme
MTRREHVVVVGNGVAGFACARGLHDAGVDVTLVGPASRTTGRRFPSGRSPMAAPRHLRRSMGSTPWGSGTSTASRPTPRRPGAA